MRDTRARQLFFAERSTSKARLGRANTTWTRSTYSRTHCQFRPFAGWRAPCKPWARNGWKTWAATTQPFGFPSAPRPRTSLRKASANCMSWPALAPSALGWSGGSAGSKKQFGHPKKNEDYTELRLTLLVNYWDRRPSAPNCRDYDGTIYPAIQSEKISTPARSPRLPAA